MSSRLTFGERVVLFGACLGAASVGWVVTDIVREKLCQSPQCQWDRNYMCVDGIVYFRDGMEVKYDPMTMQPQTCGVEEQ